MKFSISFKYSNVTFKNKETKETISFDTKAQDGNSFTFDNVDEDVVIGIVKGIKNKKAADVFSYDDFRTNFINTMARNKCKELYDKLDKGEWKVDDVVVSNITIKDLEFTKPTMNARETITVESRFKPIDSAYLDNDPDFHMDDELDDGMIDARPKSKIPDLKDLDIKTVVELSDWANDAFNAMVANGKDEREAMSCLQANLVNNGFGRKWLWNYKLTKQLLDGSIADDLTTIEELKDFCS